jgi:hypothetical protein
MLHDIILTAAQLICASNWVMDGDGGAPVELALDSDGNLLLGQGDARAMLTSDGTLTEID